MKEWPHFCGQQVYLVLVLSLTPRLEALVGPEFSNQLRSVTNTSPHRYKILSTKRVYWRETGKALSLSFLRWSERVFGDVFPGPSPGEIDHQRGANSGTGILVVSFIKWCQGKLLLWLFLSLLITDPRTGQLWKYNNFSTPSSMARSTHKHSRYIK